MSEKFGGFNERGNAGKEEKEAGKASRSQKIEQERKREREATIESKEENIKSKVEFLESVRFPKEKRGDAIAVPEKDKETLSAELKDSLQKLIACYREGFGIFPSGDPDDRFYDTLWLRDLAHAGGNFFAEKDEAALLDSLRTAFLYQKRDGSLPYRVERKHFLAAYVLRTFFGLDINSLKKIGIDLVTRKKEKPVYEGEQGGNADDTIPTVIITVGELFAHSEKGREFVRENFGSIERAMQQFIGRTDPADGLEKSRRINPDWADSLLRGGKKLGTVNVWQARALQMMRFMCTALGYDDKAAYYGERFLTVKKSIMEKLYNSRDHYMRSAEGEPRIDAAASIFGSLYILPVEEAVNVEETMNKYLRSNSGLKNFFPPYPPEKIHPILRAIGMGGYHNKGVWPWLTAQNIQVKIRIALQHNDEAVRARYKKEAVEDLVDIAKLFEDAGGAYEVFDPDTRQPATWLRTGLRKYKMPQNLMGNLAAFQSAYNQLKKLGWLEIEA